MRTNRRGDQSCKQGYCIYYHKSFTARCPFNSNRTTKCPDIKKKTRNYVDMSFYQNNMYKHKHVIK